VGVLGVVRVGGGPGGEMNQALYAHMNNKRKMKKKRYILLNLFLHMRNLRFIEILKS
jgi:hypothetical protein